MNDRPRIGIGCFVWKDGKFLIGQRRGSHGAATWSLPGGHLEFGESWEACATREVLEETGMQVKNLRFLAATNDIFAAEQKHYVTIFMEGDWASGEPTVTEPDKFVQLAWHSFADLPTPRFLPFDNLRQVRPDLFA